MPIKKGVYYLSTKKSASKIKVPPRPKDVYDSPLVEPPIGLVQGKEPGSVEEWRVALALNRMHIPYIYQYSLHGGRSLRGGQVIDFLVQTRPVPTPVYVNGEYWHRTEKQMQDQLKQLHVMQEMYGQVFPPLVMWAHEIQSVDQAYETLLQKLRYK